MLCAVISTALKAQNNVAAGEFYLMNVGTGLYLKFGGAGNAKAAEGHAGTAITLAGSDNKYTIKTKANANANDWYLDGDLKMNSKADNATAWTFDQVDNTNYYRIKNNGKYLASISDAYGLLGLVAGNSENNKEKWMLVTKSQLLDILDITPVIPSASFDENDNNTNLWGVSTQGQIAINKEDQNSDKENHYLEIGTATTIKLDLGIKQVGNYVISFEAKYSGDDKPSVTLQLGTKDKDAITVEIAKSDSWVRYTGSIGINGNINDNVTITVKTMSQTPLYLDNFELFYEKSNKNQISSTVAQAQKLYDKKALAEINRIRAYIEEYYPNGLNFFNENISTMEGNLKKEEVTISTESEYRNYLSQINQIKENAKLAHRQANQYNSDNNAIFNPGFELGNLNAWETNGTIINREEFTDGTAPGTGTYLFLGAFISQEVSNLPTGKYTLTAKVASTNGANITLTATHGTQTLESNLQQVSNEMSEIKIDNIIVYNGQLLIKVTGDQEFYADDFSLTFKELILHESSTIMFEPKDDKYESILLTRNIKAGVWNTFVVPFDMAKPAGWEVKTLTGSTLNNENISLTFSDASSIEAGKPYMVRVSKAVTEITLENVNLSTTLNNTATDHIEFIGTYTSGNVPTGAFFISSNTFYQAADESNTMKAFRAYLQPKVANARSLTYRTDGDTAIDNSPLTDDNEVTVVAIYNLQGVRLDDMQEGVNILQMSDGRVVKVIIK